MAKLVEKSSCANGLSPTFLVFLTLPGSRLSSSAQGSGRVGGVRRGAALVGTGVAALLAGARVH
jgi:hypothetical protein